MKGLATMALHSDAYTAFYEFRRAFARKHNNTILAPEFLSAGIGELTYSDFKALDELL